MLVCASPFALIVQFYYAGRNIIVNLVTVLPLRWIYQMNSGGDATAAIADDGGGVVAVP